MADAHAIKVSAHRTEYLNSAMTDIDEQLSQGDIQLTPAIPQVQDYRILKFFGSNIIVTEFDEWKRHRKIIAPAFSEVRDCQWTVSSRTVNDGSQKNNKLAFKESVRVITSLHEGDWRGKQEVIVDDALCLTMVVSPMMWLSIGKSP